MTEEKMSLDEFIGELRNRLEERLEGVAVFPNTVWKQNDVVCHGLSFREGKKKEAPIIYVDAFYQRYLEGEDIGEFEDRIYAIYETCREYEFDLSWMDKFDLAKDKIVYSLMNRKTNEEVLKERVHEPFLDLEKVYYLDLNEQMSVMIRKSMVERWQVSEEEIKKVAEQNITVLKPVSVRRLDEVLFGEVMEESSPVLYVVTSEDRRRGASVLAYEGVAEEIYEMIGPYMALPSSIHEWILVPGDISEIEIEKAEETIREANKNCVEPEDYLGDHAYVFDVQTRTLQPVYSEAWVKAHESEVQSEETVEMKAEPRKRRGR